MRRLQKASKDEVKTQDLIQRALELRKAGLTYGKIAEAMQITKGYAHDLVMKGLALSQEDIKTEAHSIIALELERLDALLRSLWANKDNPRYVDTILRVMERKAKLQGLDAPTRIEQSGKDGQPIQLQAIPIDWSKATEEQIRQAKELEAKLIDNGTTIQ